MEKSANTNASNTTAGATSANVNKAVAKNRQTGIAVIDPAVLEKDAGAGLSQVTSQDLSIPRLKVLMQLSPECNKSKPSYIEGAQPGMILNTVTHELYDGDDGVLVVPCAFVPTYSEWSPLGSGSSAPESVYSGKSDILTKTTRDPKTNKDMLPNGNYIQRDANHFVLVLSRDGSTAQEALITFKSTGLKTSKKWLSLQQSAVIEGEKGKVFTAPAFAFTYKLGTIQESNDKGTWVAWTVNRENRLESANVYNQAKSLHGKIELGEVSIIKEPAQLPNEKSKQENEDIPF